MKELIGKRVEFFVDGLDRPFSARVIEDRPTMVLVAGEKDPRPRRIIKSKIVMFTPLEDVVVEEKVLLQVLYCENATIRCPGVKFVQDGAGVRRDDFEKFMGPCPRKNQACKCGTRGELKSLDGATLREMLAGTIFGDYPEGEA